MDQKKYFTRMGDGSIVYMTADEIWADLRDGMADAVDRGKIPPLSEEELQKILMDCIQETHLPPL